MSKKVSVLVVDDSPICRQLIADALEQTSDFEIVGMAENGREAVELTRQLRPQVITMDVDMPEMDGIAAVEHIMAATPTPILMLTADPRNQAPELTGRALEVGALALQVKPSLDAAPEAWNLAREVKLLSTVKVIRHLRKSVRKAAQGPRLEVPTLPSTSVAASSVGLVAIVASTGGPQVVQQLLSQLPGDFPAPIVLVQHINAAFAASLAGWLQQSTKLKVRLATDGDPLTPGEVLIGPPSYHLLVPMRGKVMLRPGEPKDGHIPSGSMLLESAAKAYGRRLVGVVLTGMGTDGADGMVAVKTAGGRTVAQSQDSCVVFGMPGAAIARGAVDQVVHGDELAATLIQLTRGAQPQAK